MNPQVPLTAAVSNINNGTKALAASNTANQNLAAGTNVPANLTRANTNNTKAANQFNLGAKNLGAAANLVPNKSLKNKLNVAQKHFTTAAINAAGNQPIKSATHARRGINALKNYIGANLANV